MLSLPTIQITGQSQVLQNRRRELGNFAEEIRPPRTNRNQMWWDFMVSRKVTGPTRMIYPIKPFIMEHFKATYTPYTNWASGYLLSIVEYSYFMLSTPAKSQPYSTQQWKTSFRYGLKKQPRCISDEKRPIARRLIAMHDDITIYGKDLFRI